MHSSYKKFQISCNYTIYLQNTIVWAKKKTMKANLLNELKGRRKWAENNKVIHTNTQAIKGMQKYILKIKKIEKVNSVWKKKEQNLKSQKFKRALTLKFPSGGYIRRESINVAD